MSAETALYFIQNVLGKCFSCWLISCLEIPRNWGATQLKVITSDQFLCSLDCLWDSQPLKWEIWDLYIKCLFKTLYKWGNVIELEPQWGWADFSGTALILHQMKPSFCSAAGKLHLRERGRDGGWVWGAPHGVIPGVRKAWAAGMILCNPWFALALLFRLGPVMVCVSSGLFNKFPADHFCGEMELWGWTHTSHCAPPEAGAWDCYLGRLMEMSAAPRCWGGEIPFQGSLFWHQGAFNDHTDLLREIEEECV